MSKEVYTRKATFKLVRKEKGERLFKAVNRRAKHVAKRAGKRTLVSAGQLKAMKGSGSYKYYEYVGEALKPIRL